MPRVIMQWWNRVSLRAKLAALTTLVLIVGLVALYLGVSNMLRTYLIRDADRQVTAAITAITPQSITTDQTATATGFLIGHLNRNGQLIEANPTWEQLRPRLDSRQLQAASKQPVAVFALDDGAGRPAFRIAVKDLGDGTVVAVALPYSNTDRLLNQLSTLFFVFGLLIVLLGAITSRLLVNSTFAPLRTVERTAAAIARGDFSQRLDNAVPTTEVGRLNRSLNQMLNRIDAALADRARTIDHMRRFVGDASHELRTPLVSVRGYAELYRMGAIREPDEVAQAMDRIEREAIRLGSLVSDMLELARLDQLRPVEHTPLALLPLAQDAALDARAQDPTRQVTVIDRVANVTPSSPGPIREIRVAPSAAHVWSRRRRRGGGELIHQPELQPESQLPAQPAIINGNENQIRQVLTNLLGNALRFTPAGSPLEIAVGIDNIRRHATVEIIDHGEGIPAQIRDKIFERFYRADASRTRDTGGSGLGLAIVQSIVAAHDGIIGVSETAGGGATFKVSFPLAADELDEKS
jgi:two-component system OmpR family sensor kinase